MQWVLRNESLQLCGWLNISVARHCLFHNFLRVPEGFAVTCSGRVFDAGLFPLCRFIQDHRLRRVVKIIFSSLDRTVTRVTDIVGTFVSD